MPGGVGIEWGGGLVDSASKFGPVSVNRLLNKVGDLVAESILPIHLPVND